MPHLQRHVFICVNAREAGGTKGCCASKGGAKVRDEFKKRLAAHKLRGVVRANKAGCLDQCDAGVVMVVYPEQVWYQGVTIADVDEIVERHIIGGEYVERLMMPDQEHLAGATSGRKLRVVQDG